VFELHYEYICAAGWRESKTRTVDTFDELDAALEDCRKNDYTVLDNPICLSCTRFRNECAGSKNHIWTGCAKRIEVTVDG